MTIQKSVRYTLFNLSGKSLNVSLDLKLKVFEKSGNYVLHRDLLRHYTSQSQKTASTKTRSEVSGGGRKPWRQKGTGRARAGSNRSPLWKGGGVIFGPKPKKVYLKLTKKERRLALQTLLYNKKNNTLVIKDLEQEFLEQKTKNFLEVLDNLNINLKNYTLVIVSQKTNSLKLATKNLKNIELILASNLNTFSLLKSKHILLTTSALNDIKEIYCA